MASWRPLPGVVRSRRALTVSLVQSSCRRYQPRGVVGALPLTSFFYIKMALPSPVPCLSTVHASYTA